MSSERNFLNETVMAWYICNVLEFFLENNMVPQKNMQNVFLVKFERNVMMESKKVIIDNFIQSQNLIKIGQINWSPKFNKIDPMYCLFDHTFFGSPCIENCLFLVLKYKNCRVFKKLILSHALFFLLKLNMS